MADPILNIKQEFCCSLKQTIYKKRLNCSIPTNRHGVAACLSFVLSTLQIRNFPKYLSRITIN